MQQNRVVVAQHPEHRRITALTALVLALGLIALPTAAFGDAGMQLPPGYVARLIHEPSPAGPVVASHDGVIYMQHGVASGGVAISRVDVEHGTLETVLAVPPATGLGWVVGGPGESFFAVLDGVVQHVEADGAMSPWSTGLVSASAHAFSADGRMIGTNPLATELVELHPNGGTTTLLGERMMIYDVVVADDGTIYFSDFPAQELVELASNGSQRVLTSIAPDNAELALDRLGNLYLNNAAVGLARVDRVTGALTPQSTPNAPCAVIRNPAVTVFDADDRAVFFSWAEGLVTWADLAAGDGGFVIEPTWASSQAADIGPDGVLYVGVSGCGASFPTRVMSVTREGVSSMRAAGSIGRVDGLALDSVGGVYVTGLTETTAGLYYAPPGNPTFSPVPGSSGVEFRSITVGTGGQVFGYLDAVVGGARIGELSGGTLTYHTVSLPGTPQEFVLEASPQGDLYAYVSDADTFFTGPTKRWLVRLDLAAASSQEVSRHDRAGCCPLGNLGIDPEGVLWWVLNPDFLLYRVVPGVSDEIFASQIPIDAGYANRNAEGDLFVNAPEGVYLVLRPTLRRFDATLAIESVSVAVPPIVATGTGVAPINQGLGGAHLGSFTLPAGAIRTRSQRGVTTAGTLHVATLSNASGSFAATAGGGVNGMMGVPGMVRLCLVSDCAVTFPVPLTTNGTAGVGLGGSVVATRTGTALVMTLRGAAWTTGPASVSTLNGAVSRTGFVHGPLSGTTVSAAASGGVVQLVTPISIDSNAGDVPNAFGRLSVRFVPDPSRLLLLATGLGLLGWLRRLRRAADAGRREDG